MTVFRVLVLAFCVVGQGAWANNLSLLAPMVQRDGPKPLLVSLNNVGAGRSNIEGGPPDAMTRAPASPSLFADTASASLFAPYAPRDRGHALRGRAAAVSKLRSLISQAESRRHGYDAVQHGAKRKPAKRPTQMTVGEVFAWIKATPGQPHAIGRYQFIPSTLKRLVKTLGVKPSARFDARLQDRLADVLLQEAGIERLYAGTLTLNGFMHNLAKIWAGLPLPNGKSYYQGYAGNKASISYAYYAKEMGRIFPS